MDPISISGLILQLIEVAGKVYRLGKQIRDTKSELYSLYAELLALKGILEQMAIEQNDIGDLGDIKQSESGSFSAVESAMQATAVLLQKIMADLQRISGEKVLSLKALNWPNATNELRKDILQLERLKSCFLLAVMNHSV
jgi:hypothetical protein